MKIKSIVLKNFKGIDELEILLNGKSTIIFGINGVGKSSVLRAIDLIYANIIARLIDSKKKLAQLSEDDISYGKGQAIVNITFEFENGYEIEYQRSISRKNGRKHKQERLRELVAEFKTRYMEEGYVDKEGNWIEHDYKNMPIFVNYGVNRLVLDIPVKVYQKVSFNKMSTFDKAIESKIDFDALFKWFRNQEDIENQEKVRVSADYEDRSLKAVKQAMLAMLEGFEDIHIERNPLAMKVKKEGRNLKINQLSDGEKCTIALFGDLARRLTLANPGLYNPLEGQGVVLIDELDLHMHTSWQRRVMGILRKTFPNIQFIVTTHSPQILGEIDGEYNLLYMVREDETVKMKRYSSFMGWDSNVILEEVMETASVNIRVKELIREMYSCIDNKEYDKAEKMADYLDKISNGHVDGISGARVLIARGRRNEKNR